MRDWTIADLFPTCIYPSCPHYGVSHTLPCQQEALTATETFVYWQAGVGASKTIVLGTLALFYMLVVPENRGILFRRDFGLNARTVWRRFKDAVLIACRKEIIPIPKPLTAEQHFRKMFSSSKKDIGHTHCAFLHNGSELLAGQTKNMSEAMGPEYGFIGVDDAMENDYAVFTGEGTVGGFQSRLRHPQAAFYKATLPYLVPLRSLWPDVEPDTFIDMRKCFLDSNPPVFDHWLWKVFGKVPGVRLLSTDQLHEKETYCRFILTETMANDHLPPGYIAETASFHDEEDLARILQGKSVPYYGGVRVYRQFKPEKHVGSFSYHKNLPLFVGLDPGKQHPAAIVSQISKCAYGYDHHITLSEVTNLYDVSTWDFTDQEDLRQQEALGFLPHLAVGYPEFFSWEEFKYLSCLIYGVDNYSQVSIERSVKPLVSLAKLEELFASIRFCCDRSADKINPENRDRRSSRKIWRNEYGIVTRQKYLNVERSLDKMEKAFSEVCACGLARLLVNNTCLMLIEGYSGGYRFKKHQNGTHSDKPLDDHRFEDPADAHRYNVENFFFATPVDIPQEPVIPLVEDYRLMVDSEKLWEEFFK